MGYVGLLDGVGVLEQLERGHLERLDGHEAVLGGDLLVDDVVQLVEHDALDLAGVAGQEELVEGRRERLDHLEPRLVVLQLLLLLQVLLDRLGRVVPEHAHVLGAERAQVLQLVVDQLVELVPELLVRQDLLRRVLPRQHQHQLQDPHHRRRRPRLAQHPQHAQEVAPEAQDEVPLQRVRVDEHVAEVRVQEVQHVRLHLRDPVAQDRVAALPLLVLLVEPHDLLHQVALADAVDHHVEWAVHQHHDLQDLLLLLPQPQLQDRVHKLPRVVHEQRLHHRQDLLLHQVLRVRLPQHLVVLVELLELVRPHPHLAQLLLYPPLLPTVHVQLEDGLEVVHDLLAGFGVLGEGDGAELRDGLVGTHEAESEDTLHHAYEAWALVLVLLVLDVVSFLKAEDVLEDGLDAPED